MEFGGYASLNPPYKGKMDGTKVDEYYYTTMGQLEPSPAKAVSPAFNPASAS
jgi:hypothetical protein